MRPRDSRRILKFLANSRISSKLIPSSSRLGVWGSRPEEGTRGECRGQIIITAYLAYWPGLVQRGGDIWQNTCAPLRSPLTLSPRQTRLGEKGPGPTCLEVGVYFQVLPALTADPPHSPYSWTPSTLAGHPHWSDTRLETVGETVNGLANQRNSLYSHHA